MRPSFCQQQVQRLKERLRMYRKGAEESRRRAKVGPLLCALVVYVFHAEKSIYSEGRTAVRPAQGEPKRSAFWFSEFGVEPQTPLKGAQEFHAVKLRKTKTALRFWFAQGIEAE
jgi:hypothetical protein